MPAPPLADTPLGRTIATTATDIWNDSCAIDELEYAISFGAVGATANPTIVTDVWKAEPARLAGARPRAGGRAAGRERGRPGLGDRRRDVRPGGAPAPAGVRGVRRPAGPPLDADRSDPPSIERPDGRPGPALPRPRAEHHREVPGDRRRARGDGGGDRPAGSASTRRSASRSPRRWPRPRRSSDGIRRRAAAGESTDAMGPVVTIMMGRIEDWLRVQTERDGIVADPAALPWSGIAVFKRAYEIFRERGFRARLLGAAIRHHYHWSELIGGDVVITMPSSWQKRFNASTIEVRPRMDDPGRSGDRRRAADAFPGLRPGLRARRPGPRRVRRLPADRADAAGIHRLVSRAAPPGDRRDDPEPRRPAGVLRRDRADGPSAGDSE